MPKYKLPKEKKSDDKGCEVDCVAEDYSFPDRWDRRIRIPINPEMAKALSVGDEKKVELVGEIVEISSTQGKENSRSFLEIMISSVECVGDNEFEKMAKEEEK